MSSLQDPPCFLRLVIWVAGSVGHEADSIISWDYCLLEHSIKLVVEVSDLVIVDRYSGTRGIECLFYYSHLSQARSTVAKGDSTSRRDIIIFSVV